ncbi:MAG: hypothetical protein IT427_20560 [Pirellulales bacterium]|nr:hypothetical protein [Pirellulales bacterium]
MVVRSSPPEVPLELAGKWIAWDRGQTQIVGWGESFDAAKHAAAEAGWREVMIAKFEPRSNWLRGQHIVGMVAVFISQAADCFGSISDWV